MLYVKPNKNILHVGAQYEEISYKKEFDESNSSDYFNITNAKFISDMILGEMFDISKSLHVNTTMLIIEYMKKSNIKKMHIYLYPKTYEVKYETDILGIETERRVDIPEYAYTLSNLLYNFDEDVMRWFNRAIQNVLRVIDREKIKVVYHFNPLYRERKNSHGIYTTNDKVFVTTVHQRKVIWKEW